MTRYRPLIENHGRCLACSQELVSHVGAGIDAIVKYIVNQNWFAEHI